EQHRQRAREHDEHLLLCPLGVTPPACPRRPAPDPGASLLERARGGDVGRAPDDAVLARAVLPDVVAGADDVEAHAPILSHDYGLSVLLVAATDRELAGLEG